jgi:hypothetical protein
MSTNLVKRLRNSHHQETLNKIGLENLCKEAAERIEELERHYNAVTQENQKLKAQTTKEKLKNVNLRNQTYKLNKKIRFASSNVQ